jgi:hypothetical protein
MLPLTQIRQHSMQCKELGKSKSVANHITAMISILAFAIFFTFTISSMAFISRPQIVKTRSILITLVRIWKNMCKKSEYKMAYGGIAAVLK